MSTLILLRHGQSTWNLENRFTGNVDVELSPRGEEEAHHAGLLLKNYVLDVAYTSVLKRSTRTLAIILKKCLIVAHGNSLRALMMYLGAF